MKRITMFFSILVLSLCFMTAQAQQKTVVAVLDFESLGIEQSDFGAIVEKLFSTKLTNTDVFTVVERSQTSRILEEQKLRMTGMVNSETAVEIGQLLGANILVVGSISKMGDEYNLLARFVDGQTGEIIESKSGSARDINVISDLITEMVNSLADDTSFEQELKKPSTAFTLLLFLPGAGQAYAKSRKGKIWLFAGCAAMGWGTCIMGLVQAPTAKENADQLFALDPTGGNPDFTIMDPDTDELLTGSGWRDKEKMYQTVSVVMAIFAVGIHVWSAIDAADDARDYNREKGFRISAIPKKDGFQLGLTYSF